MHSQRAFTLIELLVVVSIISVLSSIVMTSLNSARTKAKIAKARSELRQIDTAINLLLNDTGVNPSGSSIKYPPGNCAMMPEPDHVYVDDPMAGIVQTDGNFPGWQGPYMQVPLDPWGNRYIYDDDYFCIDNPVGCEGTDPLIEQRAVMSSGPNGSGFNIYDADNIIYILCRR